MAAKQNVKNAVTKWETEEKKALLYRFLLMKSFLSKTTSSSSLFNPTPSFTSSRTPNSTLLLRRHSQVNLNFHNVCCFGLIVQMFPLRPHLQRIEMLYLYSLEECGRYLETAKVYENKSADLIQGPMDGDYLSRSLSHVMDASMEDLACCPDIGERKVKRLYDAFHELFKREVPKRQCIPETSVANESHPGSSSTKEDEKEVGDTSNCEKKDLPSTHTKLPERRINHKKRKKGNVVLMTKLKLEIRMAATRTES
ncbi:hypothetical protein RND71_017512 [Anisodus tanguticus]|uniref:Uncharacterized protein n=1 Tax=Anisodus tanguticus TaxID=243964 RepID=A0AAE1S496_9SOLA|nr:hypothetical protein RND71_017512 [Anisodus tanguticus]